MRTRRDSILLAAAVVGLAAAGLLPHFQNAGSAYSAPAAWLHWLALAAAVAVAAGSQIETVPARALLGGGAVVVVAELVRYVVVEQVAAAGLWVGLGLAGYIAYQAYVHTLPTEPDGASASTAAASTAPPEQSEQPPTAATQSPTPATPPEPTTPATPPEPTTPATRPEPTTPRTPPTPPTPPTGDGTPS